jgi:hypothetical protein
LSLDEKTHFQDFQFDGRWWSPETPQRVRYGTLRYSRRGRIEIELLGSLTEWNLDPGTHREFFSKRFEVVLGQTEDGRPCTAFGVAQLSGSLFNPDQGRSRYRVHRLYVGSHFASEKDIAFTGQTVEFSYLEDWLSINPFQFIRNDEANKLTIEMPVETQEIATLRLTDRTTTLSLHLGKTLSFDGRGEFEGARRAWFEIKPDNAQPHAWFEDFSGSLGNFLTICVGEPVFPRRVSGRRAIVCESENPVEKDIDIYLRLPEGREKDDVSYADMPFPFRAIRQTAESLLSSWFSLEERIGPVFGLLLGTYYNSRMYVETEFLTLMQALEIFHRRLVKGSYVQPSEWLPYLDELLRAIPSTLSSSHRKSLSKRLEYGYEYSLRKRLNDIVGSLNDAVQKRITGGNSNFVAECADTRNALVHEGGGGIESKGLVAMHRTNRQLRALLNVLIWKQLGLPDETFTDDWFRRLGVELQ